MKVNTMMLAEWFDMFNKQLFHSQLPVPRFEVGNARTRLGTMSWYTRRSLFGSVPTGYVIRISNYFDQDETEFKNVLLHEMIHLRIVSAGIKDTSAHGREFHRLKDEINSHGWNVSVSRKSSAGTTAKPRRKTGYRFVVAVVIKGGKRLFSVVSPRYLETIDRTLARSSDVETHSWYITDIAYFDSYPTVRTPKGRLVEKKEFEYVVSEMRRICRGGKLDLRQLYNEHVSGKYIKD